MAYVSGESALWELSGEDGLLDAYKKELVLHVRTPDEMKPVVRITTSDTDSGGANIYPMLVSGNLATFGNNVADAMRMAKDACGLYLFTTLRDGEALSVH